MLPIPAINDDDIFGNKRQCRWQLGNTRGLFMNDFGKDGTIDVIKLNGLALAQNPNIKSKGRCHKLA